MSERLSEFTTQPNPDQPDRCPSIDPHDTLQCTRRIHEDDQCRCGGIAWRKGSPRIAWDSERLAVAEAERDSAQARLAAAETLSDECANSPCIHLNDMYGRLRAALHPDPSEESAS